MLVHVVLFGEGWNACAQERERDDTDTTECNSSKTKIIRKTILILQSVEVARQRSSRRQY
jgi:hypothetical protein